MAVFEYRQAEEIRDAFTERGIRHLFIGKSGAILLGYPDTTQDADIFLNRDTDNGADIAAALVSLGFALTDEQIAEIKRRKDFIQLKNGPFDLDLIFAPDGIDDFEVAWRRRTTVDRFDVCNIDDIIASKRAANRRKDRESLDRLESFRRHLRSKR